MYQFRMGEAKHTEFDVSLLSPDTSIIVIAAKMAKAHDLSGVWSWVGCVQLAMETCMYRYGSWKSFA